jgi:uncharacterized membrane protein YphA (DoxX/SURF4 family)
MKQVKVILTWILGILFIATGISKLIHLDKMSIEIFTRAHYPSWLFYVVATFEFLGGVFILVRATRPVGMAMISTIMLGALSTHFYLNDGYSHFIVPIVIILLLCIMALNLKRK